MPDDSSASIAAYANVLLDQSRWYEAKLDYGADPSGIYRFAEEHPGAVLMFHHFQDEPWHKGRFVVRLCLSLDQLDESLAWLDARSEVVGVDGWAGEQADRNLFDWRFDHAMMFFQASSVLSYASDDRLTNKLVHCVFNARGMSPEGEARWALHFLWGRLTIRLRIAWLRIRRGKKWWTDG